MEQILNNPNTASTEVSQQAPSVQGRQLTWGEQLRRFSYQLQHLTGGRRLFGPLPFLALSLVLGLIAVVSTMYVPAYIVSVGGVELGIVEDAIVFEQALDRVETRVEGILGTDYTMGYEVSYEPVLTDRQSFSSIAGFETYLFEQVTEVVKSYVITVDGVDLGSLLERSEVDAMFDRLAEPYITEYTTSISYDKDISITLAYTPAATTGNVEEMEAILTANTRGETVYEVVSGDTFMAIAFANNMSMDDLEALNPDVNVNSLHIGQLLVIEEEIPYLSIQTVESVSYEEAIASPIVEVADDSMYQGDSKTLETGTDGVALVAANVTYVNGVEKGRDVLSTTTLVEPTDTVMAVGTLVRPTWYPNGYYIWPVYGTITSTFGYRYIFGSTSFHSGIDISVPYGTTVKAADGGIVVKSGYEGSYGNLVAIDHQNGEVTYYAHNSSLLVSVGDKVYQGQAIALAGSTGRSTGNHCHFEIRVNGTQVNPLSYLN